jgi:hypothetical protein
MSLRDRIWPWGPKPAPTPAPAPAPTPPGVVDYLKAWKTLRGVPVEKLGALAALIPIIVFMAVSGLIAWTAILIGLFLRILWLIVVGERRVK